MPWCNLHSVVVLIGLLDTSYIMQMMITTNFEVVRIFYGKEWAWHPFSSRFPPVFYEIALKIGTEDPDLMAGHLTGVTDARASNKRPSPGTGPLIVAN